MRVLGRSSRFPGGHFWTRSTLEIDAERYLGGPISPVAFTRPLFENAANVKNFVLRIGEFPSLRHFTFPNLTTLDFSTSSQSCSIFLKLRPHCDGSGRLQADRFGEGIPPGRVKVLPCVKAFPLRTTSYDSGCEVVTHPVLTSHHLTPPHHPRFQSGCVADLPD
jgi:hypothetical protein